MLISFVRMKILGLKHGLNTGSPIRGNYVSRSGFNGSTSLFSFYLIFDHLFYRVLEDHSSSVIALADSTILLLARYDEVIYCFNINDGPTSDKALKVSGFGGLWVRGRSR
mgnify:CR=1 FL=1